MSTPADLPRDLLVRGLAALGVPVAAGTVEKLAHLCDLVAEWTRRVDLTAHDSATAVARHLVLGSLALCEAAPAFESLADLGSGAGFPGLPIAIAHPRRRVTLIDSRERRVHFQRAAIRALGLENARPLLGRAEELEAEPHDAVVAQATSGDVGRVMSWMLPWVAPGGWLLLPGGPTAPAPPPHPDLLAGRVVSYRDPLDGPTRTLWIARRR